MSDVALLDSEEKKGIFAVACYVAGKAVSKVPLAGESVNFVCGRITARDRYIELQPVVMKIIELTGRRSRESMFMLNEIEQTAASGLRRYSFHRMYVQDLEGWKKLPKSPDNITYGYW